MRPAKRAERGGADTRCSVFDWVAREDRFLGRVMRGKSNPNYDGSHDAAAAIGVDTGSAGATAVVGGSWRRRNG